jgi:hypothetical protein
MIEEADVVVVVLEGLDLRLDERVESIESGLDVRGDVEVHVSTLGPPPRRRRRRERTRS